jgi:Uma2 family endonuclease
MKPATTLVSVEEYLNTSYDPDRDYVDGVLVERNVGEWDHSDLQSEIVTYLRSRYRGKGIRAVVEQRVQVAARHFRVPDVCIVAGNEPPGQIITRPPLAVIEILTRDDRAEVLQDRIDDYLAFGIRYVWVINPRNRRAFVYTTGGMSEAKDGILQTETPHVVLPLPEVFEALP